VWGEKEKEGEGGKLNELCTKLQTDFFHFHLQV
jgi:hypothetical protein